MVRIRSFIVALGAVVVAAGCGGDGSSINSGALTNQGTTNNQVNNGPSSGDVGVYVTDSLSDKYDHVWVSIKKVELKLAAGGMRTIFDDSRGVGMDLASLHGDSGPKYRFINELTMPAGTYVGAQITVAKSAILFPLNTTAGKAADFDKQPDGAADAVLSVDFDPPKLLGTGHDDLVFDFDLSKWKEDGGKLTAIVTPSLGAGLEDADRNSPVVEDGTIDDLKGDVPGQAFSLKSGKSAGISVATSATTALVSETSETPFVLAKDQKVEVSGAFDTNTRKFNATSIRLQDPKAPAVDQVTGVASAIDPKSATWSMTPNATRGLLPQSATIPITVSSAAKFFGSSGLQLSQDDFFKALSASKTVNVLAEGTYDASKNQFLASEARLQDMDPQPEVKVVGLVSQPQSDAQTFGLTVTGYQGMMTQPGASATVAITASTTFVDEAGKGLSSAEFFSALSSPKGADVDGVLDTSTGNVLATSVKLSAAPAAPPSTGKKRSPATKQKTKTTGGIIS